METKRCLEKVTSVFSEHTAEPLWSLRYFAIMPLLTEIDGELHFILNKRAAGVNQPGDICFPGGHVEPGESFVRSAIREVKEETGLDIENPILCGTKQFQTRRGERYVVLFYKSNRFSGELTSSEEGEVFWIPRKDLQEYQLVPDFMDMVRVMESDHLSEFYYYQEEGQWRLHLL